MTDTGHNTVRALVRHLHRQVAGARAAGDRLALDRLTDQLARAECALTRRERDGLWLEVVRGIEPASFDRTPPPKTKSTDREDRQ